METNDRRGAEVRVSTSPDQETLVTSGGKCGHIEIPWIADSKTYNFGLYGSSQPEARLDSVPVRRAIDSAPKALQDLADEVRRETSTWQSFPGLLSRWYQIVSAVHTFGCSLA